MSSIAIITDAACDLPARFIEDNNIFILPFNVITQEGAVIDNATPSGKLALYASHIKGKSQDFAQTAVLPAHEIESFFFQRIVLHFESAIFISVSASRSEMFAQMQSAWNQMSVKAYQLRRDNGMVGNFKLYVIDSNSMGPGQGLLAYAAVAAVKASQQFDQVVRFIEKTRRTIFTYAVAEDLLYAYTRAKSKNEKSITWSKYALANVLNLKPILRFHMGKSGTVGRGHGFNGALAQVLEHIETALRNNQVLVNMINVSYSGDLQDIESLPEYLRIKAVAAKRGVELMLSHMSVTLAVHIGEKALMIGFATESSDWNS